MTDICAYCYYFKPCPCGECGYGMCFNTASLSPYGYVYEDEAACMQFLDQRGAKVVDA